MKDRTRNVVRTLFIIVISLFLLGFMSNIAWAAINVSEDSLNSSNPQLAISGANQYLLWQNETSGEEDIFFSKSAGGLWSSPENVSSNSGISTNPKIAVDSSGDIHLVWQDDTSGDLEIYYKRYNGTSWSSVEDISDDDRRSVNPSIAVDSSDNPYVVWQSTTSDDTEIYFSKNDGVWSSPANISNNTGDSSYPCAIADSTSKVHVVWVERSSGSSQIAYRRYDTGSWSSTGFISGSAVNADFPKIAVGSNNNPRSTWQEENSGRLEIFYANSTSNGDTWSSSEKVSSNTSNSKHPDIAVDDDGNTHLIWEDHRIASQGLTYRLRNNSGWQLPINITFGYYQTESPSIDVNPQGTFYLAYSQVTDSDREIFFSDTQYGITPGGPNRSVQAGENVSLLFASISSPGYSNVVISVDPPMTAPDDYRFLDEFYFDISTTAGYTGNIFITVPYDESLLAGEETDRVRLIHWTGSVWQDITISQDINNKTVTGQTTSLSGFVLTEGTPRKPQEPFAPVVPPIFPVGLNKLVLVVFSFMLVLCGVLLIRLRQRYYTGSGEVK